MQLEEVNNTELDEVLSAEDRGVIIDFWGTWCQPCRTLRPHLEQLADDFSSEWRVVAVHVEENPEIVVRFEVTTTPTLLFLKRGDEVRRVTGAVPPSTIAEAMADNPGSAA